MLFTERYKRVILRRLNIPMHYKHNTHMVKDVVAMLGDIANAKQEHMVSFTLSSNYQIIKMHVVYIGTLTQVDCHPRELFIPAFTDHAARIVIAHNHPYGEPEPSAHDIEVTQRLFTVGRILGIPLSDHIVVAGKKHFSMYDKGYIDRYPSEALEELMT